MWYSVWIRIAQVCLLSVTAIFLWGMWQLALLLAFPFVKLVFVAVLFIAIFAAAFIILVK